MRVPFISCALVLALVACGGSDPVDSEANRTAGLPDINVSGPSTAGEPHAGTSPATAAVAPPATLTIPAALQGRWGLTPGDCTTALGNAKGLLVINGRELRFYESRAVPSAKMRADADSIAGDFRFTGEGETWTKYMSLKRDKQLLVRTETQPAASFSYAKCG
jgi:hypothetical protein